MRLAAAPGWENGAELFGPNGSGDALGTWLILMLLGAGVCLGGGLLAFSGRWRRWYRPVESPIRYAPLAAIPFGAGCLIELVATAFPPPEVGGQVVAMALFVCLILSLLLFLRFPAALRPGWVKRLDGEAEGGTAGEGGPAAR
jgi:hypothetical protein